MKEYVFKVISERNVTIEAPSLEEAVASFKETYPKKIIYSVYEKETEQKRANNP